MGKDEFSLLLFCIITGLIIIFINYHEIIFKTEHQSSFGTTVLDVSSTVTKEISNVQYIEPSDLSAVNKSKEIDNSVRIYEVSTSDFLNLLPEEEEDPKSVQQVIVYPSKQDERSSSARERPATAKTSVQQGEPTKPTRRMISTQTRQNVSENMILIPDGEVIYNNISVFVPAFYIDKYEISIADYQKFDPSYMPPSRFNHPDMPATNISYEMAEKYARSIGKRLPTEVEWIRAARGSTNYDYAFGDRFNINKSRVGLNWESGPTAVGSYDSNELGVYDMTGNVWEWVSTNYINPKQSAGRNHFILKGGSWYYSQENSKIDNIRVERFDFKSIDIGFRCVMD
jgi:formylglycine-generating enzyme required for sulfatase activity